MGPDAWPLFKRLVEQDLLENLFPDWVDFNAEETAAVCGIPRDRLEKMLLELGANGLLRIRDLADEGHYYQYRVAHPLFIPCTREELIESLHDRDLPERPELWRYWEEEEGETKYEQVLRLYERTCGLKMSGKVVEDLVELAENHSFEHLAEAFEAAREEGVTALGWIRKYLKRLGKHERIQKDWGRPRGLELPEGYTVPSEDDVQS
jgi:hypothetical protein